jgi:hypothetical protein
VQALLNAAKACALHSNQLHPVDTDYAQREYTAALNLPTSHYGSQVFL